MKNCALKETSATHEILYGISDTVTMVIQFKENAL